MLRIKEINEDHEFKDLQETWNNVLERSRDNNIFLTWEWLWNWWKHYGREKQLMILLAREKNKIIAIAPLMYSIYKVFGLKLKKIEFIGASAHSDYSNFILTEKQRECIRLFMKYLSDCSFKWDCLEFRGIPETAQSLNSLRSVGKNLCMFEERLYSICTYISLSDSFEALYKRLHRNMRKNLRKSMRHLNERFRVEVKTLSDFSSIEKAMDTFYKLHQKRQRTKGLPGAFGDSIFRSFLLDVTKCFMKNGWLDLSFITINKKPIASALSFEYNHKLYVYNQGFDPEYSKYSPGNLIILQIIKNSIQKGLTEFDFLRGVEAYKSRWNTLHRKNIELSINKGFLGSLYSRIKQSDNFIVQKLRSIYEW